MWRVLESRIPRKEAKGTKGSVSRFSCPFVNFVFQNPADKQLYQRQIEATDRQIDALVYELYGLTEEEIVMENADSRD